MLNQTIGLVNNMQDSRPRLIDIRSELESVELQEASEKTRKIFDAMRQELNHVLDFMDRIASFDPTKFNNNREQINDIQASATSIQRSLVEARIKFEELKSSEEDLIETENKYQLCRQVADPLRELIEIYQSQIESNHIDFEKLNLPEADFLLNDDFSNRKQLKNHHRAWSFYSLVYFANLNSDEPNRVKDPRGIAFYKILQTRSSQFIALEQELSDDIDLINGDCMELAEGLRRTNTINYDPKQYPYLENLIQTINKLLVNHDHSEIIQQVIEAIYEPKNENYDLFLINKLIKAGSDNPEIKLSELARVIFTLKGLRIKALSVLEKTDAKTMQNLIESQKTLNQNDGTELEKANLLSDTYLFVTDQLKPFLCQDKSLSNLRDKVVFLHDPDTKIDIYLLKKEFSSSQGLKGALEDPESQISKLMKRYRIIFIKAGIDAEQISALDGKLDNDSLRDIIDLISIVAREQNSINLSDAARLIYILGQSFKQNVASTLNVNNWLNANNDGIIPLELIKKLHYKKY